MNRFNLCEMSYYWRYELGLSSIEQGDPLWIGKIFHDGLAGLHATGELEKALATVKPKQYPDRFLDAVLTGRFLLERYKERCDVDGPFLMTGGQFQLVGVEPVLRFGVDRWTEAAARLDGLVLDEEGGLWVLEFKTRWAIDKEFMAHVALNAQVTFYELVAQKTLRIPKGVIYITVSRPRLYRRKGEEIAEYLKRAQPDYVGQPLAFFAAKRSRRDDRLLSEKLRELKRTGARIRACQRSGVWCKNDDVCFLRQRKCSYVPLCEFGQSVRTLAFFEYRKPHEELLGGSPHSFLLENLIH